MGDYDDFGPTEEQYDLYTDLEFAIPLHYELSPITGMFVGTTWEFSIEQMYTKTLHQVWLILTSKMRQCDVNRAIACAKACLPIHSRIEHLRGMLRRMEIQPEGKERMLATACTYSIKGACYTTYEHEGCLFFSRYLSVTKDYKVELHQVIQEESTVALEDIIPDQVERIGLYKKGYFGDVKLMDLSRSREIIETGLTFREKRVISCWFDTHVLRINGFEVEGEHVSAMEYLDVGRRYFGLLEPKQPWYVNVPLFITENLPLVVACGCECHCKSENIGDISVSGPACFHCQKGSPRIQRSLIDVVDDEDSYSVFITEHWSCHSTIDMNVIVLPGKEVVVNMFCELRFKREKDRLLVTVTDRNSTVQVSEEIVWCGYVSPVCIEVLDEGSVPVLPLTNQPAWMNYIVMMGYRRRTPLPFKLPHMIEAMGWNGYQGDALFMPFGDNYRFIDKTTTDFVARRNAAVELIKRASHFAVGIFLRDVFLVKRLIGVDVFFRLLMRDVWAVTGLYFSDLMFPRTTFVYSATWHQRYRSLMSSSMPFPTAPRWLILILMFTPLNNDLIKVLLSYLERFPIRLVNWWQRYEFESLDFASCHYEDRVQQRVSKERARGLIRVASMTTSRKSYENMKLVNLESERLPRSLADLEEDADSPFCDQKEMGEFAISLSYQEMTMINAE